MQNILKLCSQVIHLNSSAINHTLIPIYLKNICIGLVSKTKPHRQSVTFWVCLEIINLVQCFSLLFQISIFDFLGQFFSLQTLSLLPPFKRHRRLHYSLQLTYLLIALRMVVCCLDKMKKKTLETHTFAKTAAFTYLR